MQHTLYNCYNTPYNASNSHNKPSKPLRRIFYSLMI
nr:MAG TPA: hypothetical protein [Caudoviricetes sp.]